MADSEPNTIEREELDLNGQFKSTIVKPIVKSEGENTDDLMKFTEGESNLQLSYINDYLPNQSNQNQQNADKNIFENFISPNVVKPNGFQEKDGNLYEHQTGQIRKELIQSNLESLANELIEKEKSKKKLIDEAALKEAEHQKLLDSLDSQKANNRKNKDLLRQTKQIDLLTNELADLQLQLAEKVQENESIQRKYASVIEEVTTNENDVKKLRNEATLKDLEYKRLLDNLEKEKRKVDAQNNEIADLTERLAAQIHEKELIQRKLNFISEELETLRNVTIARQEERMKLLESIECLGMEKAANQKNKEELAKLIEKCKNQHKEIVDLRKTLNMQITFTTIVILSAVGMIGWNYFISDA